MTLRALFMADGPSDLPLADHLEALCAEHHREVEVTRIDPRLVRVPSRSVEDRLRHLLQHGAEPDIVFVHRDAENQDPSRRSGEVRAGAVAAGVAADRVVPVVPVRMTEAWLLLDEGAIRRVAGRPNDATPLGLPGVGAIEGIADPKQLLRDALLEAGAPSGRRRRAQFERDFGEHRALLLQRLDRGGPVNQLTAWQQLKADIATVLSNINGQDGAR